VFFHEYTAIELIMPYTNVDIFREKGPKNVSKKVWEPLNFMKKWVKNNHSTIKSF
jgi:hypothetical protein